MWFSNPNYRFGERSFFYFSKKDVGVSYTELLRKCGVPEEVIVAHPAATFETNRCFFLHLGLATGLNPFLLQACFRREARRLLDESSARIAEAVAAAEAAPNDTLEQEEQRRKLEEHATGLVLASPNYLFEPVVQNHDFIDMEVLTHIWPVELADVRICLVPINDWDLIDTIIVYTPEGSDLLGEDGEWRGRELILSQAAHHFTWLSAPEDWKRLYGSESLVSRFLSFMRANNKCCALQKVRVNPELSLHKLT